MPENHYTDLKGQKWAQPTLEELKPDHPVHDAIVETLEAWHPNYVTDSGRISSYEDWLERVEGLEFPDDLTTRIEIGSDMTEHPYKTIKKIAQKLAKELA